MFSLSSVFGFNKNTSISIPDDRNNSNNVNDLNELNEPSSPANTIHTTTTTTTNTPYGNHGVMAGGFYSPTTTNNTNFSYDEHDNASSNGTNAPRQSIYNSIVNIFNTNTNTNTNIDEKSDNPDSADNEMVMPCL